MTQILNVKLNLDKFNEAKAFKGKSGRYYDVTIIIGDEADKFGNNVSVFETQTQEEREAKANKNYIGNGKTIWGSGQPKKVQEAPRPQAVPKFDDNDDTLPF